MKTSTTNKWMTCSLLPLLLLMACACNPPKVDPQQRATVSFQFNYATQEEIESFFSTIDIYQDPEHREFFIRDVLRLFGKCRIHTYDIMNVQRISPAEDFPAIECDDLTGFFPESWAKDITPWGRELKRYGEDECR